MAADESLRNGTKWDRFLYWCGRFVDDPRFESDEREYKLPIAEALVTARVTLLNGESNWQDRIRLAVGHKNNNLSSWRQTQPLEAWFNAEPGDSAIALRHLWNETLPVRDRFNQFASIAMAHRVKAPISETTFLHMAMGIEKFPPFRSGVMDKAMELTSYATPKDTGIKSGDIGMRYEHFLRFLDTMLTRGSERGVEFRDRLDAQSAAWTVTQWYPLSEWSEDDKRAFGAYQGSPVHRKETWKKPE